MKPTKVVLLRTDTMLEVEFGFEHAENLLRMPNNGGWVLPENSKYQYDDENGLTIKRNTKKD